MWQGDVPLASVLGALPMYFNEEDDSTGVADAHAREDHGDTLASTRYLHIPTQLRIQHPWCRMPIHNKLGRLGGLENHKFRGWPIYMTLETSPPKQRDHASVLFSLVGASPSKHLS